MLNTPGKDTTMKLVTVFASIVLGLSLGTSIALAGHHGAPTTVSVPVPPVEVASTVELPEGPYTVPTVVIVGRPPVRKVAAKAKSFVCGPMHDNMVGGRNSDCVWR